MLKVFNPHLPLNHPDWKSSLRDALRTPEDLKNFFDRTFPQLPYKIFIPKKLALKIKRQGLHGVLARQFLPSQEENILERGLLDPIGDQIHNKTGRLIHRYHQRALLFPLNFCPVDCRYCFRKNELNGEVDLDKSDSPLFSGPIQESLDYLQSHPQIEEVILSGGDPLMLDDHKLSQLLDQLRSLGSVKYLRFHTRTPVILPERVNPELLKILSTFRKSFQSLIMVIHTNHISEWDEEIDTALEQLASTGITLMAQSVLLRGVNDRTDTLLELFQGLMKRNIRPYYLHHPDQTKGTEHFWLSLEEGRKIFWPLHHRLPGWALPHYVMESPEGGGKIPVLNPEAFEFSGKILSPNGQTIHFH